MVCAAAQPSPAWHDAFLAMVPAIKTHARISFRYLKPEARAEAIQECICNAMVAYERLVALNKTDLAYPTVLAKYAVSQTKDFRKVGGHLNIRDVSSDYCQRRKGVVMERLDKFDRQEEAWEEILVQDKTAGPAEVVATKLDFIAWLKSLPGKLRRIAKALANGARTSDVARRFRLSAGRISQIRKLLRQLWLRFLGENSEEA